jgi:hypothetical protein
VGAINFNYDKNKVLKSDYKKPGSHHSAKDAVVIAVQFVLRGMHTQVYADYQVKGKLLAGTPPTIYCGDWADEMATARTVAFVTDACNDLLKTLKTAKYTPPRITKITPTKKNSSGTFGHQWTELQVDFTHGGQTGSVRIKTETNLWYGNKAYRTEPM